MGFGIKPILRFFNLSFDFYSLEMKKGFYEGDFIFDVLLQIAIERFARLS